MTEINYPSRHPAIPRQYDEKYLTELRKLRSFEAFEPFFFCNGVDTTICAKFKSFVKALYDRTGNNWESGNCRSMPEVFQVAKELLKEEEFKGIGIAPLGTASRQHFWLKVVADGEPFVFDPWGQDLPFFGPAKNLPRGRGYQHAGSVYTHGMNYMHFLDMVKL